MRVIKDIDDANTVAKQLLDHKSRLETKDWDRHGLQIKNNADATDPQDYVTLRQLPKIPPAIDVPDQHYAIVFSFDGQVVDAQTSPPYQVAQERIGIPLRVKASADNAPNVADAFVQVQINSDVTGDPTKYVNMLQNSLKIPLGSNKMAVSSNFIIPLPKLGTNFKIRPQIVTAGGMGVVTITLVVKRLFGKDLNNTSLITI